MLELSEKSNGFYDKKITIPLRLVILVVTTVWTLWILWDWRKSKQERLHKKSDIKKLTDALKETISGARKLEDTIHQGDMIRQKLNLIMQENQEKRRQEEANQHPENSKPTPVIFSQEAQNIVQDTPVTELQEGESPGELPLITNPTSPRYGNLG